MKTRRRRRMFFRLHELLWVLPDLRRVRLEREPQAYQVGLNGISRQIYGH
jgi:hypothetical protein